MATVASQRVGTLRMLWAGSTVEAFIYVCGAAEESEQTEGWLSKVKYACAQLSGSSPPKTHAEPRSITCAGEMAGLFQAPVIPSGRRETRQAAALVPPRQVFAD